MSEESSTLPRASGIYRIVCIPSGKSYIGSAVNISLRRNQHYHLLRHGKHHSIALQRAWTKYGGESAFRFEVVELVEPERLVERENHWFAVRQEQEGNHGYNMAPIAGNTLGTVFSPEALANIRAGVARRDAKGMTEARRAGYVRRSQNPPSEATLAFWERRRAAPLTEKQKAAYAKWKERGTTPAMRAAHERRRGTPWTDAQRAAYERRRGWTYTPEQKAKHAEIIRKIWANRTKEESEAIRKKSGDTQRGKHYPGRGQAGKEAAIRRSLEIQAPVWAAMEELGWVPTVPMNAHAASKVLHEKLQSPTAWAIGRYLRRWEQEGRITLVHEQAQHPPSPPFTSPPSLTQATLFDDVP